MKQVLPKPQAQLLSIRQIAVLSGVSTRTIFRWMEAGLLPGEVRIGRGPNPPIRFRKSDIEEWIASGCHGTDPGQQ
jgi:excisionase family DNA binding protein